MAKMKRSEKILWIMVAVALAANIVLPRLMQPKYSWDRDLAQRIAANLLRPDTLAISENAGTPPPSGRVHSRFAAAEYGPEGVAPPVTEVDGSQAVPEHTGSQAVPERSRRTGLRVRYSITVPKGTFRLRQNLRCWLPFPQGARLIEAGVNRIPFPEENITLSGTSSPHSSLYMQTRTSRYKDITFYEVYEYDVTLNEVKGLEERSEESYLTAMEIARWIRDSITLAPMKEYSTIDDVPAQVLSEKKGDEGGKALLFIKMCQDKGIQARYRSGFEPSDGKVYLREWAEVSADGKEWIPAYLGGKNIPNPDSIILINNDSNGDLFPAKTYPRSDNVDFLRGEVEWDGGNLYFPLWNSEITIEYL